MNRKLNMEKPLKVHREDDEHERFEPEFFSFDKHRLDEEIVAQPKMYFSHAVLLADARRDYEQSEAEKDLTYAELSKEIRSDPQSFGLDKITEDAVKQTIVASKRYQRAAQKVIDKRHDMDVAQAGVTALDHRKRGLEKAVDLFLSDYFATPRVPDNDGREKAREADKMRTRKAGQKRANRDDD